MESVRLNKYAKYFKERGPDLRKRRGPRRSFTVSKMWDVHHEIARLNSLGMKGSEIAKQLGVTPVMVSYTLNSPVVQDKVAILRASRDADTVDLMRRVHNFAPKCLDLLERVISGKEQDASIPLRVRTAEKYADRVPALAAVKKHQVVSATITKEDLDEIKGRAKASGIITVGAGA